METIKNIRRKIWKQKWWPEWIGYCTDPEAAKTFYAPRFRKIEPLFEGVYETLRSKLEEGSYFWGEGHESSHRGQQYPIFVSLGGSSWPLVIERILPSSFGSDRKIDITTINWEWRRECPHYNYSRREIVLDYKKLSQTSHMVVEPNPPKERKWIEEKRLLERDQVDVEQALNNLLIEIPTWKPRSPLSTF